MAIPLSTPMQNRRPARNTPLRRGPCEALGHLSGTRPQQTPPSPGSGRRERRGPSAAAPGTAALRGGSGLLPHAQTGGDSPARGAAGPVPEQRPRRDPDSPPFPPLTFPFRGLPLTNSVTRLMSAAAARSSLPNPEGSDR